MSRIAPFPPRLRLGTHLLIRYRQTGDEADVTYHYRFGRAGRLSALQASPGGC